MWYKGKSTLTYLRTNARADKAIEWIHKFYYSLKVSHTVHYIFFSWKRQDKPTPKDLFKTRTTIHLSFFGVFVGVKFHAFRCDNHCTMETTLLWVIFHPLLSHIQISLDSVKLPPSLFTQIPVCDSYSLACVSIVITNAILSGISPFQLKQKYTWPSGISMQRKYKIHSHRNPVDKVPKPIFLCNEIAQCP